MRCAGSVVTWTVLAVALATSVAEEPAAPVKGQLPRWEAIEKACRAPLHQANLQDSDLLARGEAQLALAQAVKLGWRAPEFDELLARVPADDSFLIRTLRDERGIGFMRRVAQLPQGFDRLERLARLPRGERMVRDLVANPGGHKLIDYMTKSAGGKQLGEQLSNAADGRDFNESTGQLYTPAALLEALKQLHTARTAPVKAPPARAPRSGVEQP
jgi:hypothetical protein